MLRKSVDNRWFKSILADRQISQRGLAKIMRRDPGALSLMLRGKMRMQQDDAVAIARALDVPLEEVMARMGLNVDDVLLPGHKVAVIGTVAGDWSVSKTIAGPRRVTAPGACKNLEALRLGNMPGPWSWLDGQVVYVRPVRAVGPDCLGRLCLVGVDGGRKVLAVLRRGVSRGRYSLMSMGGEVIATDISVTSSNPVVWVGQPA